MTICGKVPRKPWVNKNLRCIFQTTRSTNGTGGRAPRPSNTPESQVEDGRTEDGNGTTFNCESEMGIKKGTLVKWSHELKTSAPTVVEF